MFVLVHAGTATTVGEYGIAVALVGPVMAFANLQLRGLQGTDARDQFSFGDYLGLRSVSTIVALPVMAVVAFWLGTNTTVALVSLLVAARLAIASFSDIFYGYFQRHEHLDKIAQANAIYNVLVLVFFGGLMLATGDLVIAAAGTCVAAVGVLVIHNIPTAWKLSESYGPATLRPAFSRERLTRLFVQAIPLAIISVLISLNANMPRYFLEEYSGLETLGIFVALISFVIASDTVVAAFAQTISPRLAKHFAQNDRDAFVRLLAQTEAAAIVVALVAVPAAYWLGPPVVSLVYQPEYASDAGVIAWLAAGAGINMMSRFIANAVTVLRILYVQVLNNVVSLLVLLITCTQFIPSHGLEGAAMAIVAASLTRFAANLVVLSRYLGGWARPAQTDQWKVR